MRHRAMAATAVRLGLEPPGRRPGSWFLAEDIQGITSWRAQVGCGSVKPDDPRVVYVGTAEGASRTSRT
eukprot:10189411-Heterocapsa_arctica.AAC.1